MVFTKLGSALALATVLTAGSVSAAPRVDPSVHRALRQQGNVDLILTMKKGTTGTLKSMQEATFATRGAMIEDLVQRLELNAKTSQAEVMALLAHESTAATYSSVQSFWVSDQISIKGASVALVERLAGLTSVGEIREELFLKVPEVIPAGGNTTASSPLGNEWGVAKIQAPEVWAGGNTGEGVVVAAIDTGVRGTHEALKANFRGDYGWFDPEKKAPAPYDNNGHGSHTMGTIAGQNGIGVAPGARWVSCKGCRTSSCPESDLLACGQFMTCPTDPAGNNKDCSKAPRLVSNSWGGGQGSTFYKSVVDAWRAAGIIPIFANGNSGPNCGTANSPGDYDNVIAVGATDSGDGLASFSSKGPAKSGILKPELSAPGANVRSAWYDSDTGYNAISGTSMATPHVSGAVALLLAAKPSLTFNEVREALLKGVDTATLKPAGKTCGGTADGTWPNNNFGYGRLNILKTIGGSGPAPSPTSPSPTDPTPSPTSPTPTTPTPSPTTPTPTPTPNRCSGYAKPDCVWWNLCRWDAAANVCKPLFG